MSLLAETHFRTLELESSIRADLIDQRGYCSVTTKAKLKIHPQVRMLFRAVAQAAL